MNRSSICALLVTGGVLVASENLTVMVSPFPNTASSIGSESAAFIDVISGPGFMPKFPVNAGD